MVPPSYNLPAEGHSVSLKSGCLLARLTLCTIHLNHQVEAEEIYKSIDSFVSFIFSHFADEEAEMNKHMYPNLQAHQEDHTLCCCAVLDKFREVRRGLSTVEELEYYLMHKFCGHISVFDSDYVRFLNLNNLL